MVDSILQWNSTNRKDGGILKEDVSYWLAPYCLGSSTLAVLPRAMERLAAAQSVRLKAKGLRSPEGLLGLRLQQKADKVGPSIGAAQ